MEREPLDPEMINMMRDALGDMPGLDAGFKKKVLHSLNEEEAKSAPPPPNTNVPYFEQQRPDGDGACSWDPCPCSGRGTTVPRGTGHLYIPQSAAEFRRDCLTWRELMAKFNRMAERLPPGARLMFTDVPVLVCERGLVLLDIDPAVAAEDAKYWWRTGMIPLRATPPKSQEQRKREQEQAEKKRQQEAEARQRAEDAKRAEEAPRVALESRMETARTKAIQLGIASRDNVDNVLYDLPLAKFRLHFGDLNVSRAFFKPKPVEQAMTEPPNKSLEPTAVGAVSSASRFTAFCRRWLSFFR